MRWVLRAARAFTRLVCWTVAVTSVLLVIGAVNLPVRLLTSVLLAWLLGAVVVSLTVAWLLRNRDRTPDAVEVLAARGELPEDQADDVMAVADAVQDRSRDGGTYVWPEAEVAFIEREMARWDRKRGRADEAYRREAFYLRPAQEQVWMDLIRDLWRPVPVVPGKEQQQQ